MMIRILQTRVRWVYRTVTIVCQYGVTGRLRITRRLVTCSVQKGKGGEGIHSVRKSNADHRLPGGLFAVV
jgi:hypothetical protein